jgi:hypothetical protein
MKHLLVLSIALCFFSSFAIADLLKDEKAASSLVISAMEKLSKKGTRGVFEVMAPYWTQTKTELEAIISDSLRTREQALQQKKDGKYIGFEKLFEKKIGDSLFMVVMLEKNEKRGIPWYFSFYRPRDSWVVWSVYWNPNYEMLLLK